MESTLIFNPPSVLYKTTKKNSPRAEIENDLSVEIARLVNPSCPSGQSATAAEMPYTVSDLEASLGNGPVKGYKRGVSRLLIDPETLSSKLLVPVDAFVYAIKYDLTATQTLCNLSERLEHQNSYLEGLYKSVQRSLEGFPLPADNWEIDFYQLFHTVLEIDVQNPDTKCNFGAMPNLHSGSGSGSPGGENGVYEGLIFRYPAAEIFINIMRLHRVATTAVYNAFGQICDRVELGEDDDRIFTNSLTSEQAKVLLNLLGVKRYLNYLHLYLIDTYRQSADAWDTIVSQVEDECLNGVGRCCSPLDAVQLLSKLEFHPKLGL